VKVVLFSGGLDSLLLARAYPDALLLHIDYGQPYRFSEGSAAQGIADYLNRGLAFLMLTPLPSGEADGHIAHRNLYLAVSAAARDPTARLLLLGGVKGETSPDKTRRFLRASTLALSRSERRSLRLAAPLRKATKAKHLRRLVDEVGRAEAQRLLDLTVSCYRPPAKGVGCGRCLACVRRWVAVELAGLEGQWEFPPATTLAQTKAGDLLPYIRRTPLSEMPGVAVNQLEALRALHWRR
jgi:7-cyano-7-deazaguanine synthase in queuosine biosynthesis